MGVQPRWSASAHGLAVRMSVAVGVTDASMDDAAGKSDVARPSDLGQEVHDARLSALFAEGMLLHTRAWTCSKADLEASTGREKRQVVGDGRNPLSISISMLSS